LGIDILAEHLKQQQFKLTPALQGRAIGFFPPESFDLDIFLV
jgi:hypothetical protein